MSNNNNNNNSNNNNTPEQWAAMTKLVQLFFQKPDAGTYTTTIMHKPKLDHEENLCHVPLYRFNSKLLLTHTHSHQFVRTFIGDFLLIEPFREEVNWKMLGTFLNTIS